MKEFMGNIWTKYVEEFMKAFEKFNSESVVIINC